MCRIVALLFVLGMALTASGGPSGVAVASHGGAGRMQPHDGCPQRGTWPGPRGPHFLNEFNDGNCGVLIQGATFPDSSAGTPAILDMDSGTWTVESNVIFDAASSVTVEPGVTLVDSYDDPGSFGGYINVNGTMTFEPGSSLQGGCPQCGIIVSEYSFNKGTLNVQGTAAAPVTMSGSAPGSWMGLAIHANSTVNIDHLNLSGAGADTQPCGGCDAYSDGIYIDNNSPTIADTTISKTFGNGIEINDWNSAPVLKNLTLTGNTLYPIQYDFLSHTLTNITGLSLSGNGHDAVRMVNNTAMQYGASLKVTWPNLGYPIIDDVDTGVMDNASLTVASGTVVKFGAGDGLGIHSNGTLTARGTATEPITFTGDAAPLHPGSWTGVTIANSAAVAVEHAHISYAGQPSGCSPCAAVAIDGDSPPITNSTVDHSATNGIVNTRGAQPLLEGDALQGNYGYPLEYFNDDVPANLGLFPDLRMTGNLHNMLYLNSSGTMSGNVTWPNFGVPYLVDDSLSGTGAYLKLDGNNSRWTVAPGVVVRFVPGKQEVLDIRGGTAVVMNGTPKLPIRFTSAASSPAPGDWGTFMFGNGSSEQLSYVSMTYGGNCGYCGTDTILDYGVNFSMTHSTINHSNGNDVEVRSGGLPVLHADSFGMVLKGSFGVVNTDWSVGQPLVDATTSCWADESGPYHPKSNPNGKGTPASDGVSYVPWGNPVSSTCGVPDPNLKAGFTWSMPDRFGQIDADGLMRMADPNDPRITSSGCNRSIPVCAYVNPNGYTVNFNACASTSNSRLHYSWKVTGPGLSKTVATYTCTLTNALTFPRQATYTVSLTAADDDGHTTAVTQLVKVRDYLVVSVGDSYASGEGNPDIPQKYEDGIVSAGAVWEDSVTDKGGYPDGHVHSQCHRSEYAAAAQAALALERGSTHSSVTFLSLACSGAGIIDGLLGPYDGVEPRVDGKQLPPQIDQLARVLCFNPKLGCPGAGARRVDALLMSIGGNDAHFADIITKCILDNSSPNPLVIKGGISSPCYNDPRVTDRLADDLKRLPGLYAQVGHKITSDLSVKQTYITEYPDPSRLDDGSWCGHTVFPKGYDDFITEFITTSEWQWASGSVVVPLDTTIANAAAANGWKYVGGISAGFLGGPHGPSHGYCAQDHWLVRMLESIVGQGPTTGQGIPSWDDFQLTKGTMHPNSVVDRATHTITGGGQWMYETRILRAMGAIDAAYRATVRAVKRSLD